MTKSKIVQARITEGEYESWMERAVDGGYKNLSDWIRSKCNGVVDEKEVAEEMMEAPVVVAEVVQKAIGRAERIRAGFKMCARCLRIGKPSCEECRKGVGDG